MATKAQEATPQPPLGPADARSFRKFVKRLVRSEAEPVLQSLSEEGAMLGKKAITSTFSR